MELAAIDNKEVDLGLSILYRGPLSSCNYRCGYCPFAKKRESAAELAYDKTCLKRFSDWVRTQSERNISVFFTPWGEALTRRWYRETMLELASFENVRRVAIQTNLSCQLDWLVGVDHSKIAFWCTYHPEEVSFSEFVAQCQTLDGLGAHYSVGIVGKQENLGLARELRSALKPEVYFWVNAFKDEANYYDEDLFASFAEMDPLFVNNTKWYSSFGKRCLTGESVISVNGEGDIRRCHFVDKILGNIYTDKIESVLKPRTCPNKTCECHIGYIHMPDLDLYSLYGAGILERIPQHLPQTNKLVSIGGSPFRR